MAWLRLLRLPAVFTAMADIFLGSFLSGTGLTEPARLGLLIAASSGLYLAGMVLNDLFDQKQDAKERPNRPLPSGQISPRAATIAAVLLMAIGIVCAGLAGTVSLTLAIVIAICVLLYDGRLKQTVAGPVLMGSCRAINVLLGVSIGGAIREPFAIAVAIALGVYVAGITWFARHEALTGQEGSFKKLRAMRFGAVVINLGLIALAVLSLVFRIRAPLGFVLFFLFVVGFSINLRLGAAFNEPTPKRIQTAVRLMLLSLISLDATMAMAAYGDAIAFLTIAALFVPGILTGRLMAMT